MPDAPVTAAAKAMAHPVRERILRSLNEEDGTIAELARRLQIAPSSARYHVKMLVRLECAEPYDDPRPGRPTRYRALVRPVLWNEDVVQFPAAVRREIEASVLDSITADFRDAVRDGRIEQRIDRHVSRLPARLDQRGWDELVAEVDDLLRRAMRKADEAAARLAEGNTGGPPIQVTLAMLLFPAEKRSDR